MKQKYFLALLFILSYSFIFSQSVVITSVVDGTLKDGGCNVGSGTSNPRFVELYVHGTINFAGYSMGLAQNGGSYVKKSLTALGTISDQFVYVVNSSGTTTFDDLYPGKTRITFAGTMNGNDAVNIQDGSNTVLDVYGNPADVSSSSDFGDTWSFRDSYAKRKDFNSANTTFTTSEWTFGGNDALDGATCSTLSSTVNIGSFSITSTTWDGSDSSDWNTSANWNNGVPTMGYNVTIPSGMPNEPSIGSSTGAKVNDIVVSVGAILTIESGGSLIISDTSSGNLTYNVNVSDTNWHSISSPVVGEQYDNTWVTNNNIVASTTPGKTDNRAIGTYTNGPDADGEWSYFQNGGGATTFNSGQGYSLKRTSSGNFSFTGTFPSTDPNPAITIGQNGTGNQNPWNFVGNPYPSYISIATLLTNNAANIDDAAEAVYVWNGTSYQALTTGHLAPGQGFFISSSAVSANLAIATSLQSHQTGVTFYKNKITHPTIDVLLTQDNTTVSTKINYLENKTTGLNPRFDLRTFGGRSKNLDISTCLVSNDNGINFMIQALPDNDYENLTIPLSIKSPLGKEVSFSINHQNLPEGLMVFIEDKEEKTITRLDELNSNYKITLNNNKDDRFFLRTSINDISKTLRVNSTTLQNANVFFTSKQNLRITGINGNKIYIKMYNILGKRILSRQLSSGSVINVSIPKPIKQGIYIVNIETNDGTINKKLFFK